ncbi:MAG: glycosyltransferase [Nitrospinae bacterium]|nr:glycosyltransferase [Nitrospinota bacterium]
MERFIRLKRLKILKKIKVLRIIARLNIGGPAVHSILLTRHLNNDRFDSVLATGMIGKGEGDMMYLANANNIKPVLIKELGREISWKDDIIAFLKILRIIFKESPDIIHTHTAKAGTLGRTAGIIYNTISSHKAYLVHTFHGHIFNSYFSTLKTKFFILIERVLGRFTDKIIAISKGQAKELSDKLKITSDEKFELIPLGLNLSPFYEIGRNDGLFKRELGLDDDTKLIGIVGRLVPVKNHRMFLDAVKKYKEIDNKKVKFIIIGDGELGEELKKYSIDFGIKDDVIFTGWRKELENIYSDLDMVVITSFNEGTPVSVIEAMSAGKPVIATDVGGVRDLFTNSEFRIQNSELKFKKYSEGILIDSNNSNSLAEGIKFLLSNPKLAEEMGKNGRVSVKGRFDIQRLVNDMEKMYEKLIEQGG